MTDLERDAKKYAFKLLRYRGRSERELQERLLRKGFPDAIVSSAMASLKKAGFIDDSALAENLRREASANRLLGYQGIRNFLLKRGVPKSIVEASLDYDEDRELLNARKLLDKKSRFMGQHFSLREKRRLWGLLARKGYSPDTVRRALMNYNFNEEDRE